MSENPLPPAGPAKRRASAKARAAYRQFSFEALSAGWSIEQIADLRKVSRRTVRREVDQALDERRLDAPGGYVKLQVSRLTKALRLIDIAIENGDLRAVGALVKVAKTLDRYHGLAEPSRLARPPADPPPLPAPPLKLPAPPSAADGEAGVIPAKAGIQSAPARGFSVGGGYGELPGPASAGVTTQA